MKDNWHANTQIYNNMQKSIWLCEKEFKTFEQLWEQTVRSLLSLAGSIQLQYESGLT